ncbi:hypothetical protein BV25DRAFT_1843215 [Artomyces pyxidatus]|uniref:Uncharacterized protein n=1 Tax=Artomyces pyxidatus TaxID=48021 RepID=A0ACB8SEY6_9AGAM|nr:hypothetical protein BV25DRAFT_1843215 [Artomyces pyxidatus]
MQAASPPRAQNVAVTPGDAPNTFVAYLSKAGRFKILLVPELGAGAGPLELTVINAPPAQVEYRLWHSAALEPPPDMSPPSSPVPTSQPDDELELVMPVFSPPAPSQDFATHKVAAYSRSGRVRRPSRDPTDDVVSPASPTGTDGTEESLPSSLDLDLLLRACKAALEEACPECERRMALRDCSPAGERGRDSARGTDEGPRPRSASKQVDSSIGDRPSQRKRIRSPSPSGSSRPSMHPQQPPPGAPSMRQLPTM